tara:strand:+ start:96 stop:218 length:123 start_codon:yes stop_codon:yes gene_type:complete
MKLNQKKETSRQKIQEALRLNLKKRKLFQSKIKKNLKNEK